MVRQMDEFTVVDGGGNINRCYVNKHTNIRVVGQWMET